MKPKTSCYDSAIGRMHLRRFAPVWILYTLGMLLITLNLFRNQIYLDSQLNRVNNFSVLMAGFNLVYAAVQVQLLFGDLYTPRLCYAIYSLPVTRGGWFGTQVILGILGSLIPNLLTAGVMVLLIPAFRITVLWWLTVAQLEFLFFFGLAILAAICAGNRFGMLVVYGLFNFLDLFRGWMQTNLFSPLIFGMSYPNVTVPLSPVVSMVSARLFHFYYKSDVRIVHEGQFVTNSIEPNVETVILSEHFTTVVICAVVGCAAIALALFLLHRRKPECAGDLVAFPVLEPVMLVLCSLCTGLVFHVAAYIYDWSMGWPMLFIGLVVGYYACLMLLQRKVNVFRPKSVLPLAGIVGALLLSLVLTGLNVFGLVERLPDIDDLEKVSVQLMTNNVGSLSASDPEGMRRLIALRDESLAEHESVERSRPLLTRIFGSENDERTAWHSENEDEQYDNIRLLCYRKDGTVVQRSYPIHSSSQCIPYLKEAFSTPENVFFNCLIFMPDENRNMEDLSDTIQMIRFCCDDRRRDEETIVKRITEPEDIRGLIDAMLADCTAGEMAQATLLSADGSRSTDYVEIFFQPPGQNQTPYTTLRLSSACTNTLSWLEAHNFHQPHTH